MSVLHHLSDEEKESAKLLAARFKTLEYPFEFNMDALKNENSKESLIILKGFQRLCDYDLIEYMTNISFRPSNDLLDIAHELSNPPPRDYFQEWTVWWKSKPLVVLAAITLIAVPAVATWIDWTVKGITAVLDLLKK